MAGDWEAGLAATKLHPPAAPAGLVRRSRLDDLLDACIARHVRLVLASAPAGSGKSTLLASWLAGRDEAVAWLQVEDSDSDPARFWSFLVDAISATQPSVANALKPVVTGSQGDDLVVVTALVNALVELTEPVVLVIDDYHLIDNASIHRGMERLIDLCPQQVTIVIATRIDPPFRLGRLRVRNQIAEIRAADLRFGATDASGLLGEAGRSLDQAHLERLCERTEGWAAGLVLAGLSLGRGADPGRFIEAFGGDDELIVDYLTDELLDGVDGEDRQRLLETSILEQLDGGVVDAVTASTGGAAWLLDTASGNQLLIRLDRSGVWFRYHHLLRDLLRLEAQRAFPERMADLHGRAAVWFESHGDDRQAIVHRLAAGDTAAAERLMRVYGVQLLRGGQIDTLRGLLDQIGDAAKTSAACAYFYGWCEYMAGRYSLADEWLDTTLELLPSDFDKVVTTALRINIALGRGDVASALAIARVMTETGQLMSHPSDLANATGAAYAWAGLTDEARSALRLAVEKATGDSSRSGRVLALVYQTIVEFEDGSPAAAHEAADAALDAASQVGLAAYHGVASAYAIRARSGGDPGRAHADAVHALNLARRAATVLALGYVLSICGDTLLDLGDATGAALIAEARSVLNRCVDPGVAGRYLTRVESRHHLGDVGAVRAPELVEQLTDRELAVLRYLPTPLSQRDISSELYVSLNTVKTHCSAIYRKLGVGDRKTAVQAARDLHLL